MMSKIVLDVLTLGDLMVDFTPAGISPKGNLLYERNPGGAPANVAVTVSRLGGKSGFLGTVSDDIFGHFLADAMTKFGVNIQGLRFTRKAPTKMAFITLDENNNRSFDFTRGEVAETYYSPEDIDEQLIDACRVFLLSTVSQYKEPCRLAAAKIVEMVKERGKLLVYDPNWNIAFSNDKEFERTVMLDTMHKADIVKISVEEAEFLFGKDITYEAVAHKIRSFGAKFVTITLGPRGCFYSYKGGEGHLPTYDVKVADTTGSGDAFIGGFIYQLTRLNMPVIEQIPQPDIERMLRFAHACGALCASRKGAMSLPALLPTTVSPSQCPSSMRRAAISGLWEMSVPKLFLCSRGLESLCCLRFMASGSSVTDKSRLPAQTSL